MTARVLAPDEIPQGDALFLFVAMIAGTTDGVLPLTVGARGEPTTRTFPTRDHTRRIAHAIEHLSVAHDVHVAVAPRVKVKTPRRGVWRHEIVAVHCLWVSCEENRWSALQAFAPAPSVIVHYRGRLDSYWQLRSPLSRAEAVRANRRLAHALGGDMDATDPTWEARPPGTQSFKFTPAAKVECIRIRLDPFTAEEIVGALSDPPCERAEAA
jgi:hypothetical protein